MDPSYEDEGTPLVSNYGIPTAVRDTRKTYQKHLAVYLILASTAFERIAFYKIAAHLVVTLQLREFLQWNISNSSIASNIFSGTSNISTLIFAIISDAKLGRAKTIIVGFFVYLIGYVLVTLVTNAGMDICTLNGSTGNSTLNTTTLFNEPCAGPMLGTLIIIAIGAGAVQSNMAVFGAEQIQDSNITSRYFDKYMIAINIGAMFATLAIPFNPNEGRMNIFTEYVLAGSLLFIGALLFIVGHPYYIHVKPYETTVANCIPVTLNAFQTWYQYRKSTHSIDKKHRLTSSSNILITPHRLTEVEESISIDERSLAFLDFAKAVNHGKFHDRIVDDVKSLRSAVIAFALLIPYWLLYLQMYATFPLQGYHMQGSDENQTVVTRLWIGDPVTIIIGILILNIFVYKYLDAWNRPLTLTTKFVIGMCFACIAMLTAGTIEKFRREDCDPIQNKSSLSIYYQLLENIFMGFSEIFAMVASYEFAYYGAPRSAQSLFMGLRFFSIGISSFITAGYIALFPTPSFQLDFSCRTELSMNWAFYTYFFILAVLQLIFIIIFIVCQKKFRIVKLNPQQTEKNQFVECASASSVTNE